MLYEPIHHRVDRVYFEASEVNKYDKDQLNFVTKKELQKNLNQGEIEDIENRDRNSIPAHKLIENFDEYRYQIVLFTHIEILQKSITRLQTTA